MNNEDDSYYSVLLHLFIINYMVIVIPILGLIVGYIVHFVYHPKVFRSFPYITDLMQYQPEGKTVNIALSITSLVLLIINYTRIKAIRVLRRLKPKMSEKKYKHAMMTLTISGYISVAAHFLMTFFSSKEFYIPHSIFLNITYISGVVNMFATDITLKTIYLSSKNFSRVLSMISFAVVLSFVTLRYFVPLDSEDTIRLTIANLFGIFAYICYYLKFFLVKYDIPDIGIRISQRIKI